MNSKRITYLIFLSLFSLVIISSIWNYIFYFNETVEQFNLLGYPDHLIYPLAITQSLGLIILITNKGSWLINWAYAGFFYNLVFAIIAHHSSQHGNGALAVIGLILLFSTYVLNKQLKNQKEKNENPKLV